LTEFLAENETAPGTGERPLAEWLLMREDVLYVGGH
jgi:hypothetical protein